MSLMVWLPLNGNLNNYGLSNLELTTTVNPTYVNNGKIGQALSTGSVTMSASNSALILNNQEFSFACWIYVNADAGDTTKRAMIFGTSGMTAPNNRKFSIFQYPTCNDLHLSWQNDVTNTTFTGGVWSGYFPSYKWTHIAITYKNPNGTIYINGQKKSTFSGISNSQSFSFDTRLFENCANNGRYLNDYRIYNHALSPLEVKHLAQGLVLHYLLNRDGFGQNNLALNTHDLNVASSKNNLNMYIRSGTRQLRQDGFYESKCTGSWNGLSFWANQLNLTLGTKITYSFYIYGNGSSRAFSFYPMMYNSSGTRDTTSKLPISIDGGLYTSANSKAFANTTATTPEYHYVTFEWSQDMVNIISNGGSIELSIQAHGTWNTGDWVCLFAPKVELGEKPTPWTPAPSDDLYSQIGLDSNVENDVSGYGNDGTRIGTFSWSSDTPRYNTSTYASGSASTYLEGSKLPSEAKTVSLWIKCSKTVNSAIFNDKTSGLQIGLLNSLLYINSLASTAGFTTTHWINDEWNHVVAINNNGTRSVYVNGQPETQSGASNYYLHNSDNFWLWKRSYNNSYTFTGSLSDLRIYVTPLSEEDVLELYHTPISLTSDGTLMTQGEYVEV